MRQVVSLFVITLLCSVLAVAGESEGLSKASTTDQLVREKSRLWDELYVHPNADLPAYQKLMIEKPIFEFSERTEPGPNRTATAMSRRDQGPYAFSTQEQWTFEGTVSEVVARELDRSKRFEVVSETGPKTLIVRTSVLDIVSHVPPDLGLRGNVYLSSVGEATFVFEIVDAETGVVQVQIEDRREIQPPSRLNEISSVRTTRATVWNDVALWARDQTLTLRRYLDKNAKN